MNYMYLNYFCDFGGISFWLGNICSCGAQLKMGCCGYYLKCVFMQNRLYFSRGMSVLQMRFNQIFGRILVKRDIGSVFKF